jgi:ERCC4-type nuclease
MLLLDDRAGSVELAEPLAAAGLPVELTRLEFGDVCFLGRGEGGAPLMIGLEHKRISDLVQSLNTDRLAGHQLPGLITAYERAYLVIEGDWSVDERGRVVVPSKWRGQQQPLKGAPPASVLEQRVMTLETRGGLRVRWTRSQKETVRYVSALYRFWSDRDLDDHRSHLAVHAPDLDSALRVPISDFRKGLMMLAPGVGMALSKSIEQRVYDERKGEGSWRRLMLLTEAEIADIVSADSKGKPRRIGPARAKRILEALR